MVEIRKGELDRWCGSSHSNMKTAMRILRGTALAEGVRPTVADAPDAGTEGSVESLRLQVLPLWDAMATAQRPARRCPETGERHPLVLDQTELKVLFHLVEHL
ncbi:hypothetical protein ACIRN5_23710, partial [Lysinibacillus fusiformis]|uniref:hypothetical protein n=1 Tax=Lysinibacillus fusiformis TaxID=28031 RepID=UPI00382D631C